MKLIIHNVAIIRTARLKPLIAYKCNGKQMARKRSVENATIVNTDTYVELEIVQEKKKIYKKNMRMREMC